MNIIRLAATAAVVSFAAIMPRAADAALLLGTNLVANGDAEAGPSNSSGAPVASIPSWTSTSGGITVIPYSAGGGFPSPAEPGPVNRGNQFFAGGNGFDFSSITQTVSVADGAASIDAGSVGFTLSAFLGGYSTQGDFATFQVSFESAANAVIGTLTLTGPGPVERGNQTGLLARSSTGLIPTGTRTLVFELDATKVNGTFDDGYADNLSFLATSAGNNGGVSVPEPASIGMLGLGLAGLVRVRRRRRKAA